MGPLRMDCILFQIPVQIPSAMRWGEWTMSRDSYNILLVSHLYSGSWNMPVWPWNALSLRQVHSAQRIWGLDGIQCESQIQRSTGFAAAGRRSQPILAGTVKHLVKDVWRLRKPMATNTSRSDTVQMVDSSWDVPVCLEVASSSIPGQSKTFTMNRCTLYIIIVYIQ